MQGASSPVCFSAALIYEEVVGKDSTIFTYEQRNVSCPWEVVPKASVELFYHETFRPRLFFLLLHSGECWGLNLGSYKYEMCSFMVEVKYPGYWNLVIDGSRCLWMISEHFPPFVKDSLETNTLGIFLRLIFIYACAYVSVCVYAICACACGNQIRALDLLELEFPAVVSYFT